MNKLLLKIFIKDYKNVKDPAVREKYGILSGAVGIVLNLLLCTGKFIVGAASHSIAITADAFNNLSDAGSSIVTLFGFKLSAKKPDKDHPFGHGRFEYIAALAVAFLVLMMAVELIKSSVTKIIHPESIIFSAPTVAVLVISIIGKLWLAFFNRNLGRRINSPAMTAVVTDSLGDICATSASLVSIVVAKLFSVNIDGYIGVIVALLVLYAGYGILKDTISPLLGEPPSREIVKELVDFVKSFDGIMGIHDLVLHNYGANAVFGSLHAEVRSDADFIATHDMLDLIERMALEKFNIHLVIHPDPLVFDDERINSLHSMVNEVIKEIDPRLTLHDFRVVDGPTHTNLIFDLVIPYGFKMRADDLEKLVKDKISEQNESCFVVMTIETNYI
ncbi:MAG: cation diffusion facilitator family transporter [Acutalibacteraceae bacterium]